MTVDGTRGPWSYRNSSKTGCGSGGTFEERIKGVRAELGARSVVETLSPSVCKAVIKGKLTAKSSHLKSQKPLKKNLNKLESELKKLEKEHRNNVEEGKKQGSKRINIEINDILVQEI